jgi:hypothetical protein
MNDGQGEVRDRHYFSAHGGRGQGSLAMTESGVRRLCQGQHIPNLN